MMNNLLNKTIGRMILRIFLPFLFILIIGKESIAQTSVEGTWRGTSICQIKNSPCHDEIVVYHISNGSGKNFFQIVAIKIVGGKEDYMGTIMFSFDSLQKTLVSIDIERKSRWEFKLKDKTMSGTLIQNDKLYRIIEVKKEE